MPLSSVATASPTSTVVKPPIASITMSAGGINTGLTVSITVDSSDANTSLDSASGSLDFSE